MKNTRKLLMAALMLVVAFAAVVSSTYAWFTLSNPLVVEDINVSVSESSGIYMAVKNKTDGSYTWRTSLTEEMLKAGQGNAFATKYAPVCATVTDGKLNLSSFNKLSSVAAGHGALDAASAGTEYTTFTIYFKADQGAKLDITSLVAAADSNLNTAGLSMLRVAVKGSGSNDEAQMWKKYQDSTSGIEVTTNPEIDANGEKVRYNSFYSVANPAFSTFVNAGILATSDNITATIKLSEYTGYKDAHNAMCVNEDIADALPTQIVTVPKYENESSIVSITFTIWLEGWDSLSTDALSGTNFSFNFVLGANTQNTQGN